MGIHQLAKLISGALAWACACAPKHGCGALRGADGARAAAAADEAPAAVREQELADFTGRKVALDASMAIYQFLVRGCGGRRGWTAEASVPRAQVAVRSAQEGGGPSSMLMNEAGDVTRHGGRARLRARGPPTVMHAA